jgi:hypothetical protein
VSEKSMGNAHDDASEATEAPSYSALQPQKGVRSCKTSCQRYNLGESELKKEIPGERSGALCRISPAINMIVFKQFGREWRIRYEFW